MAIYTVSVYMKQNMKGIKGNFRTGNIVTEIKNSLQRLYSIVEMTAEGVSELEVRSREIIQSEQKREKRSKNNLIDLRDLRVNT